MSDDICLNWKRTVLDYRGNTAKIYITDSTDLYFTAFYGKQNQCRVYGGAGSGSYCSKLYVDIIFDTVSKITTTYILIPV